MSEIDHEYTEEIVCPWCGYEYSDSWEWSDCGDNEECPECGGMFSYSQYVKVEWTTARKDCSPGECRLSPGSHYENGRPYIYDGRNWTIWKCDTCHRKITKVSPYVGTEPRVELPTIQDFK